MKRYVMITLQIIRVALWVFPPCALLFILVMSVQHDLEKDRLQKKGELCVEFNTNLVYGPRYVNTKKPIVSHYSIEGKDQVIVHCGDKFIGGLLNDKYKVYK